MNKKLLYIIFSLALFFQLEAKLTLQDCHHLALQYNTRGIIGDLNIEIEQDKTEEAQAMAYPSLNAEGQYIMSGDAGHFIKDHNRKANAKAALVVPLFNFGGMSNLISAQKYSLESSVSQSMQIKNELIHDVSQAYFRVLEAQKIKRVVEESIKTLQEQLRISKNQYEEDLIHYNEFLQVEVQFNQREQDLIQARHYLGISYLKLKRLLGIDLNDQIALDDILEDYHWNNNLNEYLTDACKNHPALITLEKQIKAASASFKGEKGSLYPFIYGFANYSTTNEYNFPFRHGLDAGVGVKWKLYDGSAKAKIRRKEKEVFVLQQKYLGIAEDLHLAIQSAFLQIQTAMNKVEVTKKNVKVAEENLRSSQEQFQLGLMNTFELLSNEEKLAAARSNYYQSLYDFHKARSDLYFAAGLQEGCLDEKNN